MSELAGKSTILLKAKELGLELDGPQVNDVVDTLKRMEHEGYHFEVADASLELLMRRATGWEQPWFRVESFRVITDDLPVADPGAAAPGRVSTEATIKVHVGDERVVETAEGNGPVNALDCALRRALGDRFPGSTASTSPTTRCASSTRRRAPVRSRGSSSTPPNGERNWTTIGVSDNIIEASWQALYDSLVYGLLLQPASASAAG